MLSYEPSSQPTSCGPDTEIIAFLANGNEGAPLIEQGWKSGTTKGSERIVR